MGCRNEASTIAIAFFGQYSHSLWLHHSPLIDKTGPPGTAQWKYEVPHRTSRALLASPSFMLSLVSLERNHW